MDMANISVIDNNNYLLLTNNIEYVGVRLIKANKMMKKSITIFYINFDLVAM